MSQTGSRENERNEAESLCLKYIYPIIPKVVARSALVLVIIPLMRNLMILLKISGNCCSKMITAFCVHSIIGPHHRPCFFIYHFDILPALKGKDSYGALKNNCGPLSVSSWIPSAADGLEHRWRSRLYLRTRRKSAVSCCSSRHLSIGLKAKGHYLLEL